MNNINRMTQSSSKIDAIQLKDFDCLGMFELEDVKGIEYLVTPMGNGKYISRGETYYTRYTCAGASSLREYLKALLVNALKETSKYPNVLTETVRFSINPFSSTFILLSIE